MAQNRYLNIYLAVLLFFLVCYRALNQYTHIDGDGRIVTSTAVLSLVYLGLYKKYIKGHRKKLSLLFIFNTIWKKWSKFYIRKKQCQNTNSRHW